MRLSLAYCCVAFVLAYLLLRNGRPTLGLPLAYLFLLLLIHLPGSVAHLVAPNLEYHQPTVIGTRLTAYGVLAFVGGLWISRCRKVGPEMAYPSIRFSFQLYALAAGWLMTYSLRQILVGVPSLNAVADTGAQIWVLPILLAFAICFKKGDLRGMILWGLASILFPTTMLIFGGFLCHGVETLVICSSILAVVARSHVKVALATCLITIVGMGMFISYFLVREDIRDAVWGGRSLNERIEESRRIFTEFSLLDLEDPEHLDALNQRLNQNFFVGLAAIRLQMGIVDYYHGRTFWEGVISLIPRVLWPNKPVYGGSPDIISNMAGFYVAEGTSYGVGNVMEFYINYGISSLVVGFLFLGWVLGTLDRVAATAYVEGNRRRLMLAFLPALAFIQPNGSVVEIVGGAAAAWVAAFGFCMVWTNFIVKTREENLSRPAEGEEETVADSRSRPYPKEASDPDPPDPSLPDQAPPDPSPAPKQASQPGSKTKEWAARNPWFGADEAMTAKALELHAIVVEEEGLDPRSDEYFAEIDRRMKIDFPPSHST